MEKIASFSINHLDLLPGIYVSRKDKAGEAVLTTFDLRMTKPNREPVLNTAELHTIEHLGATYLRNHPDWAQRVIYFGPMGCRTGNYLILCGDSASRIFCPWLPACSSLSAILRGKSQALRQKTAAIIWTRISVWQNRRLKNIWTPACTVFGRKTWFIPNKKHRKG